MSGAEGCLVLGLISSTLAIIQATQQVYEAVEDASGLPANFEKSASKLPLISHLLEDAEEYVKMVADEGKRDAFRPALEDCKLRATRLQELFTKVMPEEDGSRWDRYVRAARTIGNGSRVEELLKGILDGLQLMATKFPEVTTTRSNDQLANAIEEVSKLEPSLPDDFENLSKIAHYSSGAQNNNLGGGTQNNNNGRGNQNNGPGQQFIGTNHIDQRTIYNNIYPRSSMRGVNDAKIVSQNLPTATPTFFGRESELKAIKDCLLREDPGQKIVVLTGIGGLGKTQIALHYWSTHASTYRSRIWIDGTSLATVLSSFQEATLAVSGNAALSYNDIASRQPMIAVKAWLALADNKNWLLVIDNVEDLDCEYSLQNIIPKCDHGAVLVTSVISETASLLGALNVEVGTIENDAGAAILRRRFKRQTCTDEEKKLTDNVIEALHGVPLAIEQAGAYLQFNPSLTTVVLKKFLAKLSSPSTKADILAKIPKRSMWFYEKHRSVIDTFSLLKTYLMRNNDDALNIMLISAVLAQGEIPFSFLAQPATGGSTSSILAGIRANYGDSQETRSEALVWLRRITADELAYYTALETLEQFCCIKRRMSLDKSTYLSYSMHNVIRYWCQETLDIDKQAEWTIVAAFQLSQDLQLDNVSVLSHQSYSHHVGHVNKVLLDPSHASLVRYPDGPYWWQALATASIWARFYQRQRRFDLARRMIEVIIMYEKGAYDSQWPSQRESLETLHLQATIFWEEGDFRNALQRYKDLLQACETHLGHWDDLTIKALQELRKVQDRSKLHERNWKTASCVEEPDNRHHRGEEDIQSSGEPSALQQFLLRYSDPSLGITWLHEMVLSGSVAEVQLLLDEGADVEEKVKSGETALHRATRYANVAMVQLLLEKGADVKAKNNNGETALFMAAQNGHRAIAQLLLENGADVDAKTNHGDIALHEAARYRHEDIVQLLLERGADVDAKNNVGDTALLEAARYGNDAMVQLLLERGADIEAKNAYGDTALYRAIYYGNEAIAQLLLEKGADVWEKTNNGETALHEAAQ